MKRKLNNALNDIDQRFIDEAAEADRLDSRAPKILKFTLIPAGAAAAVALCILAANGIKPGGVDLVDNSGSSLAADSLSVKQNDQENENSVIIMYTCGNATMEFTPADSTVELNSGRETGLSGSYSVNGSDVRIKLENGHSYRGTLSDDGKSFEITNLDQELYWSINGLDENTADEFETTAVFTQFSGASLKQNTANKITTAAGFDKYITDMLKERMRSTGDQYDKQKAYELIVSGELPLDSENMTWRPILDGDPKGGSHWGTDLFAENSGRSGANVYAFQSGTVIAVYSGGGDDSIGNYIVIDHGSGLATVYAALGYVAVNEGQTVVGGEVIAHTGISGWSTEEHLHFEIRRNGSTSNKFADDTRTLLTQKIVEDCNSGILKILDRNNVNSDYDKESADELIKSGTFPLKCDDINIEYTAGYDENYDITFYGSNLEHYGTDDVYAFQSGKVIEAVEGGFNDGLGSYAVIDHGSGVATVYAHMSSVNVSVGQKTDCGDIIGQTGETGWVGTPMLHFELRRDGKALDILSIADGTGYTDDEKSEAATYAHKQKAVITELLDNMRVNDHFYKKKSEELRQNATLPLETETLRDANDRVGWQNTLHYGEELYSEEMSYGEHVPVHAYQTGEVIAYASSGDNDGLGSYVVIDHGAGLVTVYAHLSHVDVEAGQTVALGDVIGLTGSTGYMHGMQGDALHFELRENGKVLDLFTAEGEKHINYNDIDYMIRCVLANASDYDKTGADQLKSSCTLPLDVENMKATAGNGYSAWNGAEHHGVDLYGASMANGKHANVYAYQSGRVVAAVDSGFNNGLGSYVVIDHGSGLATVYAALGDVKVSTGDSVNKGDIIALTGTTGVSSGEHLHFEVRENSNVTITNVSNVRELVRPLPSEYAISEQMYGYGGYYTHKGIDFSVPSGTEFKSADSGNVIKAEWYYGYGNCVMIQADDGLVTLYGHCSELLVTEGQLVNAGDIIGRTGSTGQVSGEMLHFEVRPDGIDSDPVNPLFYISEN